jgi:hypothetical protein
MTVPLHSCCYPDVAPGYIGCTRHLSQGNNKDHSMCVAYISGNVCRQIVVPWNPNFQVSCCGGMSCFSLGLSMSLNPRQSASPERRAHLVAYK